MLRLTRPQVIMWLIIVSLCVTVVLVDAYVLAGLSPQDVLVFLAADPAMHLVYAILVGIAGVSVLVVCGLAAHCRMNELKSGS